MPVLTQCVEHPQYRAERQPGQTEVPRAQLKSLALQALTMLSMGSVLTALIAVRAALSLWHLHA